MNIEPRTLAGFMELLPNEQILFEQMKTNNRKNIPKIWIFTIRYTNTRTIRSAISKKQVEKLKNRFTASQKEIQTFQ